MLLLGHLGITLAATQVLDAAILRGSPRWLWPLAPAKANPGPAPEGSARASRGFRVDYRLVLVGSLLPDIVDKTLGMLILASVFSSSRMFGHSLLFGGALGLVGSYLYWSRGRPGPLVLALASLAHLAQDSMWRFPQTLFWPFYGWEFPRMDLEDWVSHLLYAVLTYPSVYVPEIIGGLVLLLLVVKLLATRQVSSFLGRGYLE